MLFLLKSHKREIETATYIPIFVWYAETLRYFTLIFSLSISKFSRRIQGKGVLDGIFRVQRDTLRYITFTTFLILPKLFLK